MTFAAVVVVYNVSCKDSPTCCALQKMKCQNISVLIYDNSTSDYGNRAYCEEMGWVYLGGEGNMGISKAYNACIDYLYDGHKTDFLCLFDDDTLLDDSYFSLLETAIEKSDKNIFVPLIYADGNVLSPCILKSGHKVSMFANEQDVFSYSVNELTAINSCMAIRLSLFCEYRYDENIFLDGVDHSFVMEMREREQMLQVFDYHCNHAFSGVEHPSLLAAITRFRIYMKDYKYILRNNKKDYVLLVGKRALALTLQYRSLKFLKAFFSKMTRRF